MDNDDAMVGKVLSRRAALRLFGITGGVAAAGLIGARVADAQRAPPGGSGGTSAGSSGATGLPGCVVRPAMTEGPFFVDEKLNRSDVRPDSKTKVLSAGVPLTLTFLVSKVGTGKCEPRSGVMVDIWHCDAAGKYSDEQSEGTAGKDFLRGYQMTDAGGKATFKTVYPGWYNGRAVHIHFKLRTVANGKVTGEFTSQLFFDDALSDRVYTVAPYSSRSGKRNTLNSNDNIYGNGGSQMLLKLEGSEKTGFTATFDVGLNIA
jgi:protocatechuate 3,4-dioxygenase beta subunit